MFRNEGGFLVRRGPRNPVGYAVFEGRVPTAREFGDLRERGLGLHVLDLPDDELALSFLAAPEAAWLTHLSIADARCTEIGPVGCLENLVSLGLYVNQVHPFQLTQIPRLQRFHGPHRGFRSIADCPHLEEVSLQGVEGREPLAFLGHIRHLELVGAPGLTRLPDLAHPDALEVLWIVGARGMSLSGVSAFSRLHTLSLENCAITDADAVLTAPSLRTLGLISSFDVSPRDPLLAFRGDTVTVMGRHGFTDDFVERAATAPAEWRFLRSSR